jgi:hypothetical protein
MTLSDDVLSAYLDGELPADEMARVERALQGDAQARERLAAFRRVQALVGEADSLSRVGDAPAHVAAAIRAAPVGVRGARGGWFGGIVAAFESVFALPRPALAGFAVVMIAVGLVAFGAGRIVSGEPDDAALLSAANDTSAGSPLRTALERVAMGGGVDTAGGHITLVATFRDREGRYCREYDYGAAAPGTASVTGIACRDGAGAWRVEVAVLTQNDAVVTGYVPASDDAHRAIEAFVRDRANGAPLDAASEAKAIAGGWE